jgi:hypothetical protein
MEHVNISDASSMKIDGNTDSRRQKVQIRKVESTSSKYAGSATNTKNADH